MAVFKVPRITTTQRLELTLEPSEVVYDVNKNQFFGGDGLTTGGFPIGRGINAYTVKTIILTADDILNKYIILQGIPTIITNMIVVPEGGIPQRYGIDFTIIEDKLSWDGLGLDGFLEENETLTLQY